MISRELLYTGMTRAKEELYIVCEADLPPYRNQLASGAARAVIPGITLAEKIEYFQAKAAVMTKLT
jgi:ATP-dependent exoDNAse (exonuclease V) beta subunit